MAQSNITPNKGDEALLKDGPIIRKSMIARTPPQKSGKAIQLSEEEVILMAADEVAADTPMALDGPIIRKSTIARTPPQKSGKYSQAMNDDWRTAYVEEMAVDKHVATKKPSGTKVGSYLPSEGRTQPQKLVSSEEEEAGNSGTDGRPFKRRRENISDDKISVEETQLTDEEMARVIKILIETRDLTKKVLAISSQLSRLVGVNPNTKVEIKKGISELAWVSSSLDRKSEKIENPIMNLLSRNQSKRVETVNCAVQTDQGARNYREQKGKETDEQAAQVIEEAMKKGGGVEDFLRVMHVKWPSTSFRKVKPERGDIFSISREWDLATLVPKDFDMEHGPNRVIRDHYQGIEELCKQDTGVGEVAYLLENLSFPTKDGSIVRRDRHIYYGVITERAMDTWHPRDLYAAISKTKELLEQNHRRKIAWVAPHKIHLETFKKAVEFAFADSEAEIKIVTEVRDTPKSGGGRPEGETSNRSRNKNRRDEIVIVKTEEGKCFAETLRRIRHEVDVESAGSKVSAIRKTRDGDVLLRVRAQQGGGQAESLKEAIIKKLGDVRIQTIKEREMTVHISGLDGVTEMEELEGALRTATGNTLAMVKVNALWPAFGGTQNASATLHKREAEVLIKKGRVKVGWLSYRVRERLQLKRCYKCWGHGHLAVECTGVNRELACMKCCQEGHKAKDCHNEEACWDCEERGHRGGTAKCPKYRLLLAEASKAKKRLETKYD